MDGKVDNDGSKGVSSHRKSFLDRFIERIDAIDANSLQAYILHLSRERGFFETIFNAIDEGILVIDKNLRIKYFNRAAKEILGLPQDLKSIRLSQLLPALDWSLIIRGDAEAWAAASRQEIVIAYPEHRVLQFYLAPQEAKEGGFATVILRDVTASHEQNKQELESQTMEAISLLAANVAHEIGNPLNSIYLNLQLLERQLQAGDALDIEEQVGTVRDCKKEVERLDNLINRFLLSLRPGNPQFKVVDLQSLLLETLNFMRHEIEIKDIVVDCCWSDHALPQVMGDAEQLKQAFYNIIKNAVQAMDEHGCLVIRTDSDEDYVTLEFIDNGKGMSIEELSRIFRPFQSFRSGGNGLGMLIIEKIIREHGAELGVATEEGQGALLKLRFPRMDKRVRFLGEGPVD